eukprot:477516-Hanusia_phi.AAC.2
MTYNTPSSRKLQMTKSAREFFSCSSFAAADISSSVQIQNVSIGPLPLTRILPLSRRHTRCSNDCSCSLMRFAVLCSYLISKQDFEEEDEQDKVRSAVSCDKE